MNDTSSIDVWKRKAFALSSFDASMGSVLTKSVDFMSSVVRDGLASPKLEFALEQLKREHDFAMELDQSRTDPLRTVVYGVNECIATMVAKLAEQNAKLIEENAVLAEQNEHLMKAFNNVSDYDKDQMGDSVHESSAMHDESGDQSLSMMRTAKQEYLLEQLAAEVQPADIGNVKQELMGDDEVVDVTGDSNSSVDMFLQVKEELVEGDENEIDPDSDEFFSDNEEENGEEDSELGNEQSTPTLNAEALAAEDFTDDMPEALPIPPHQQPSDSSTDPEEHEELHDGSPAESDDEMQSQELIEDESENNDNPDAENDEEMSEDSSPDSAKPLQLLEEIQKQFNTSRDPDDANLDEEGSITEAEESKSMGKVDSKHTCRTCAKVFTYRKSFINHVESHKNSERPRESKSEARESSAKPRRIVKNNNIDNIAIKNENIIDNQFQNFCKSCMRNFARPDHLARHLQNIHGIVPHECTVCNARFHKLRELNYHRRDTGHGGKIVIAQPIKLKRIGKIKPKKMLKKIGKLRLSKKNKNKNRKRVASNFSFSIAFPLILPSPPHACRLFSMILLAFLPIISSIVVSQASKCADNEACIHFTMCGIPGAIEKVEFYNSTTLFTPYQCTVVPTHQTFEMHFRPIDSDDLFIHLRSTMSNLKTIEFAMNKVTFRFAEWNNVIVKEGQETIGKNFTETSAEGYPFTGNFTITTKESSYDAFANLRVTVGSKTWSLPGFAERLRDSIPSEPEPEEEDSHIGWAIFGSLILLLLIGGGVAACCYMIYHMESLEDL